jgi:long-subunit fatty acid transport protein
VIGDVELDANWENWGKTCNYDSAHIVDSTCTSPGQFRVQIESGLYVNNNFAQPLNINAVNLGLQDTFGVRLGGSYHIPVGGSKVIARAGYAYDSAAAKEGWLRASFDGAARHMLALGGAYDVSGWLVNASFGYVHEGTNTNPGAKPDGSDCNPISTDASSFGCLGTGAARDPSERQGPDPTNPLLTPDTQAENPYNQGSITSHYMMFSVGFSKNW